MDNDRKVTIAVAWFNLVGKQKANDKTINGFIKTKTDEELQIIADNLIKNYTTEEMVAAATAFEKD